MGWSSSGCFIKIMSHLNLLELVRISYHFMLTGTIEPEKFPLRFGPFELVSKPALACFVFIRKARSVTYLAS